MARMRSGFAVIADTQHLPVHSLLLADDLSVDHLTDLDWKRRTSFLFDLALLGEAVERACRPYGLRRMNYEVRPEIEQAIEDEYWKNRRLLWRPSQILSVT